MTLFLLDTNVISELRRLRPHGAVLAWLKATDEADLFVSAVTLGEIQAGIEMTRDQDPARATQLENWADHVMGAYNVLAMDARAFRVWGRLMHRRSQTLYEDAMIASIAIVHDLTVVTRNTRDFIPFGVRTLNPFK